MDNGVKDINVIGLVVAAIPGGGLLRNVALEGVKNSVSYTVKEGFQVNKDVTDVALATVKGAAIGKISDKLATVGVGAGAETKLTNKEAQSAARAANRNIAKARNNPPATHT
ncbi:hypothetical protein ASU33_15760 [Solirubrum puertoriconensis]|uniref:Uncharacterized protein n=2 Tax=Solirubrum puertoriconensis TaxID=1751427 RepID=A0A9X0HKT1_SOLP1|nr:hypothetical protein ASU33_15760 [Solirubrum puertoriconensis]